MKRNEGQRPYIDKVASDNQQYLQSLVDENKRLTVALAEKELEGSMLKERIAAVETESRSYSARYVEVEQQNTNLANLYVAGYQLHGSLDREHVLGAIREIIINLIGSEDFAVFERTGEDLLELVGWFEEPPLPREVRFGSGVIGQVAATGEPFFAPGGSSRPVGITACVPLTVDGRVTGVIALFRLLPQKQDELQPVDEELLGLLASQAGIALHCTRLHQDVLARTHLAGA